MAAAGRYLPWACVYLSAAGGAVIQRPSCACSTRRCGLDADEHRLFSNGEVLSVRGPLERNVAICRTLLYGCNRTFSGAVCERTRWSMERAKSGHKNLDANFTGAALPQRMPGHLHGSVRQN